MLQTNLELFSNLIVIKTLSSYVLTVFAAFICAYLAYPLIVFLGHSKKLHAMPNERSSHKRQTPFLGGVGLFMGFMIASSIGIMFLHPQLNLLTLVAVYIACFTLFLIGLKDDIIPTRATVKLVLEILVGVFVITVTHNQVLSLQGLAGISMLPIWGSFVFSLFVMVVIINALNLIDGIDGLAGVQSLIFTICFGAYFALNNRVTLAILSCCLGGALIAFLFFNLSNKRKIFMGDSGSIFVGFLMAYFAIAFLNMNSSEITRLPLQNSPVVIMSLLSYPLLDTLRVFTIRLLDKRSPFSPDRNHIHHLIIDLGLSHKAATVSIAIFTIAMTSISIALSHLEINLHLFVMIAIAGSAVLALLFLKRKLQLKKIAEL